MPSVDNRVVEMRFDNKNFESGVSTSLSTIDKLKKSLNFKEASKGFDELDRASKKVDFSSLADAIDVVTHKFSPMGVIADQVLRRIGDAVADVEHKMIGLVKGMSVDQISAGWTKLNQKTQSVQTIMNATGLSIEEVNKNLDRLMWYSDETSFGFTDMTSALETMTAKGGKLENLIPMLMGFGNAVAYAGKSSAEFKHGIQYSLTQAYSLGYMGTMDWRTLQTRGIGSKQLQTLLLKWARELGTGDYAENEFSQALTDKIFTTEVMEKALSEFAEMTLEAERLIAEGVYDNATEAYAALSDQFDDFRGKSAKAAQQAKSFQEVIDAVKDAVSTGWMVTFEHIFGNLTEQTELWSWLVEEFLEVFAYGAESRNTMLGEWHNGVLDREAIQAMLFQIQTLEDYNELVYQVKNGGFRVSGYDAAIEALTNLWGGLKDILFAVKAAWNSVIPPATAEQFVAFTVKIRDVTASFREMFTYVEEKQEEAIDPLLRTLGLLDDTAEETSESVVDNATTAISSIDELAQAVIRGEYGNGQARFDALTALGVSWKLVQNRVEELMGSSYRYALTAEEEAEANSHLAEETEHVAEATEKETEELKESSAAILAIQGVVRGLAGIVSIVKQTAAATWKVIVKPALKGVLKLLKPVFLWLSNTGNKIAEIAERWKETGKIEQFLTKVTETFKRITAPFVTFARKVKEIFDRVKQSESFSKFVENLGTLGDALKDIGGQVGEKVLSLFDKLNEKSSGNTWVDTVVNLLTTGLDALNKLLDDIIPKLQQIDLDNLGDFFDGFSIELGNIQHFFENPATFLTNLFSNFDPLSGFDDSLDSFFGGITEDVEDVGEAADGATTGVLGFTDAISSLLGSFNFSDIDFASGVNAIIEIFNGLGESLKNITSGMKITDVIAVLGVLSAVGVASAFKKVGKAAAGTFGAITGFVNHIKRRHAIPMLLQIAIAVVAVAGAFMMVASIPADKMKSVIDIMIQIFISLASLVVVMTIFGKALGESGGKGAAGLGVGLLMLAGSFLVIAYALTLLSGIKTDGLIAKIGMIGLVLLELAVISRVMTKGNKDGKGAVRGALSMVLLVGAVWLLLQVLKKIENISAEKILINLLKMQPIIFAMLELAVISRMAGKGNRGLSMILLVGSIWVMAKVLESLNNINISSSIIGKLAIIEGALLGLAIIARIMSGSNEKTFNRTGKDVSKTSKSAQNIGFQILEMAAALYVIALAMEKIAALDPEAAWRAAEIIDIYLGIFAVITAASKFAGQNVTKAGIAILLMSAALFVIAEAMNNMIGLFTRYSEDQVWKAFAIVELFMSTFGAIMLASKGVSGGGAAAIFGMALAIAAIAGALWFLKDVPYQNMLGAALGIGIILVALAGSLRLISGVGAGSVWLSGVLPMIVVMGAIVAALWGIMAILNKYNAVGDLTTKLIGISILILAIAGAVAILSAAKFGTATNMFTNVGAFLLVGIVLEALLAGLILIAKIPGFTNFLAMAPTIIRVLNAMIPLIGVLVLVTAALGAIGSFLGGAAAVASGAVGLVEAFVAIGLIIAALASIAAVLDLVGADFDTFVGYLDKAILFAQKIGEFIGAFFSGIGVGLTDGLPAITQNISDAMTNLEPALETFKKIDSEVLAGATNLTLLLMELSSAEFLDAIGSPFEALGNRLTGWISRDNDAPTGLTKMMDQLKELFQGMYWIKSFMELNGIDDAAIGKINSALDVISAMMGIELPKEGGWLTDIKEWATGSSISPANFSIMLSTLGNGVAAFYDSISGQTWSTSKVDSALSVLTSLANLSLPKTDGGIQSIFGSQDMEKFGTGMEALAKGLNTFYVSINSKKWDSTDKLDAAVTVAGALAELNNKLPATGGKLQRWLGSQDLATWGSKLVLLALGLNSFYRAINLEDWNDTVNVDGAIAIANLLSELNNSLPPADGILQAWLGNKSLSDWGTELADFALGLITFRIRAATFNDGDVENAQRLIDIIKPFLDLKQTYGQITNFGEFISAVFNGDALAQVGESMGSLGEGLASFQEAIAGAGDWSIIDTAVEKLTAIMSAVMSFGDVTEQYAGLANLDDILTTLGNTSLDAFSSEWDINSLNESLLPNVNNISTVFTEALDPALSDLLTTIGESAGTGLATGLGNKELKVKSNAQILKNAILTKFTTIYTTMYNIGVNAGQGLIDGMNAKTVEIKSAAEAWGTAISEATANALDENSPSRVMRSIGQYAGEGLALGITDMQSVVEGATSNMTLSSINTARDALRLIATAIDSDIEMDPTIRPVMDLSNLRYGAAQASSIMDRTFSTRLGYSMASQAGGEFAGAKNAAANSRREQSSNYTTAFREVRADLHELKDTIADMQVVLNTGETIGALRRPMDSALGKSARYSNRRI